MPDPSLFDRELELAWRKYQPPEIGIADVPLARRAYDDYFRMVASELVQRRSGVTVEDTSVPSRTDSRAIPVRIYRPEENVSGRCLVYLHGGAFVMGGLDFEDDKCYSLALRSRSVVVSVDYRLAPEHAFPVPVEDCYSALCWVAERAPAFGADPDRIAVGGCSAGGALAASAAQLCLDRGGPRLALQMLLYPVLDASLSSPSIGRLGQGEERRDMERMWRYYLGGEYSDAPDAAVPAQRRDLTGLPHAYIAAAELDGLCDEAITYAQRLLNAGVSAELHVWPKCPHAFDLFAPEAEISRESVKEQADALVRFLG